MRATIIIRVLGLVAAAGTLVGCSNQEAANREDVSRFEGDPPIAAPWLRERLPAGIVAYLRIPHPLGLVGSPKGNTLDDALGSDANMRNLIAIDRGLSDNLLRGHPLLDDPALALLLGDMRSPIEVAVAGLPAPSALIAATTKFSSAAELEASLEALSATIPLMLAAPLDDEGFGTLVGLPTPALLHFDAATGRLLISGGPDVTPQSFAATANALQENPGHPMLALEERIDSSGQGFMSWVDVASLLPLAQAFAPPETSAMLQQSGLAAVRSIAAGAGSAGGKGRFSVLLDVGEGNLARPYPIVTNTLSATAVGTPDAAFLLSLPSAEEFARLETMVLGPAPADRAAAWQETKANIAQALGFEIEELLSALGPELLVISDEAGDYGAVRVRDAALFDDLMSRVAAAFDSPIVEREVDGRTFHQWRPRTMFPEPSDPALSGVDEGRQFLELLGRMRDSLYWLHDGEHLYVAGLPQPLIDRARSGSRTELGGWLAQSQGVDWSSSLAAGTGSIDKLPMRAYYVYIQMMQGLADLAGAEYDIWAMPTAAQLGLPAQGAIGASLNLGEPHVSLELTYETQPAEFLLGAGGMGSVAAVGVLAAVAIPAYQDYRTRSVVTAGLSQASAAQAGIAEHYAATGRFPNADETRALEPPVVAPPAASITVEPGTGTVTITFAPGALPNGGSLRLRPEPMGGAGLAWSCGGSIEPRHLPGACR